MYFSGRCVIIRLAERSVRSLCPVHSALKREINSHTTVPLCYLVSRITFQCCLSCSGVPRGQAVMSCHGSTHKHTRKHTQRETNLRKCCIQNRDFLFCFFLKQQTAGSCLNCSQRDFNDFCLRDCRWSLQCVLYTHLRGFFFFFFPLSSIRQIYSPDFCTNSKQQTKRSAD